MNYGPLLFLAAFFALATSWFGFVLTPVVQLGQLQQTNTVPAGVTYPVGRPGLARQGLEVYRANGCAACHTQQIGQTGTTCDVVLTEPGTNQAELVAALLKLEPGWSEPQAKDFLRGLPKPVLQGVTKKSADAAGKDLSIDGAKAETWVVPGGPDIARGWGKRRTVAEDFVFDYPVMLGSQRIGPDLADVGTRLPDANWQLLHLYAPGYEVKGSVMPPYRFLFETHKIERHRSADALNLPPDLAPPAGYEVVPTARARALVAYLLSLRIDQPLFVAPMTVAAASTSTNGAAMTSTNAASMAPTNSPAK